MQLVLKLQRFMFRETDVERCPSRPSRSDDRSLIPTHFCYRDETSTVPGHGHASWKIEIAPRRSATGRGALYSTPASCVADLVVIVVDTGQV